MAGFEQPQGDDAPLFQRIAVLGMGLMGASFAYAVQSRQLAAELVGYDKNLFACDKALSLGFIQRKAETPQQAVAGADLVLLAVPVLSVEALLLSIKDHLDAGAIVSDVGSVKSIIVQGCERVFGRMPSCFVPGHPIAGSEQTGVEAADADLFQAHQVILTPLDETDPRALAQLQTLWQRLGARVDCMSPAHHDEVLAETSHLPHMLAYTLVDSLARQGDNTEIFNYAAGGLRDFTRIAASDPVMWHDIAHTNRPALLKALDLFTDNLKQVRLAIERADSLSLLGVFTRAKAAREHFNKILASRTYMTKASSQTIAFNVEPGGRLSGTLRVPGDKSISHRSIMLGSLAQGKTEVFGFLEGEDSLATLQAFRDMGVVIEGPEDGHLVIHGVGLHGLRPPPGPLYLGNSGTAMRLLSGLLAAQAFDSIMTGDESLSRRPMNRVAKPLREMGAVIQTEEGGRPPLKITGGQRLTAIDYELPMASAQVKSCLLLAGLYAAGSTQIIEPAPTRDHTERMLRGFGYAVTTEANQISLTGGAELQPCRIEVPADISSAAFFMVAASVAQGSELLLPHVGVNPTRTGIIDILRLMGAQIELGNERLIGGEPVADIRVTSSPLRGIDIPEELVPLAIDEFPVIFIAAACAEGTTRLTGAEELRVKESDRIQVMVDGLVALGVDAQATDDGAIIQGGGLTGGRLDSHGDHRIAMAFTVAALRASGPILIDDCANVNSSFPGFVELCRRVGITISSLATD